MEHRFVCYNRDLYSANQVPLTFDNRAFKYGDSFFETVRCNGHFPLHFPLHYARMRKAILSLKMNIASMPTEEEWVQLINKLLKKNGSFAASRLRIEVFRSGKGLYTPQTNNVSFIIESSPLETSKYTLNEKGKLVDDYTELTKKYNPISFHKSGNALPYVLAAMAKNEQNLDDCFLWNDDHKIIEATSSNLFWFKNKVLYTPSIYSGCVDGVMRRLLMKLIKEEQWCHLVEVRGADQMDLLEAEEIFLTNAIQGIQWVVGYRDKRFFNYETKKLIHLLNQYTFG